MMMSKHILKTAVWLGILGGTAIGLVSCNSGNLYNGKKYQSPSTGWMVNDPVWGGFQNNESYEQPVPARFRFIPGGYYTMGMNQEDLKFEHNNPPRPMTVSSFYMDEVETSNADYKEYIYWLHRVYGESHPEMVRAAMPDPLVWNSIGGFRDPMTGDYFENPGYNNYPVVGVSWIQARDYCVWRTDRYNEYILWDNKYWDLRIEERDGGGEAGDNIAEGTVYEFNTDSYLAKGNEFIGINAITDMSPGKVNELRAITKQDGILMEKLRLPTEAEWEYAALALAGNTENERLSERRVYPWNGKPLQVRASDKDYRGMMLGNFTRGKGDYMGTAGGSLGLNDGAEYTAPVYSYYPNDFGLFNMAGNVAEWCLDVYRPMTFDDADDLNAYRGNVYVSAKDSMGEYQLDEFGRIIYHPYTDNQLAGRDNFTTSDNRNFGDGDNNSLIAKSGSDSTTSLMYGASTLISDNSRVVKGGSWKDRAYYMSPATRRYLEEDRSAAWIGFRCVMSRIGPTKGGATDIKRIGSLPPNNGKAK